MNFKLPYLPERPLKPRNEGLTMMMDKGLSTIDANSFIESGADYTDFVKIGFGTAIITKNLKEKIKLYKRAHIIPYFGGTLFEAFIIRNQFEEYRKFLDEYKCELAEISDGSVYIPHDQKLEYIRKLSQQVTVISEVGSKQSDVDIPDNKWVEMMKNELDAGSVKVIAEARESGTIGIYNSNGSANIDLIKTISDHIDPKNIIWEAPTKKQQVWFIQLLGANVNLGNIATNEIVALEALRLGLRGDTFFNFLPNEMKEQKHKKDSFI
jgi:phosphosulfolactate synthase